MATLIVYNDSDKFVHIQSSLTRTQAGQVYQKMVARYSKQTLSYLIVSKDMTPRVVKETYTLSSGELTSIYSDFEIAKKALLSKLSSDYNFIYEGYDPDTKAQIYVDCELSDGTVYRMNAGEKAATKLGLTVTKLQTAGSETLDKLVDFYNEEHLEVPLEDVVEVSTYQADDAYSYWSRKSEIRTAYNAVDVSSYDTEAEAIAALKAVDNSFDISVE